MKDLESFFTKIFLSVGTGGLFGMNLLEFSEFSKLILTWISILSFCIVIVINLGKFFEKIYYYYCKLKSLFQ